MPEETTAQDRARTEEAWREVGRQFQELGQSLAAAFRATVDSEEGRRHLQSIQTGVQAMADDVNQAIREASVSSRATEVRVKAEKAATTARFATEEAFQEARPSILAALRQVNTELQKLIAHMDEKRPPAG
jgi:ATP-dependent exoDNAse (exonuclease V) alpha subunit